MLVIPALDGSCWLSFYSLRWDHCDSFYRIAHLFMAQLDESLRKSINSHLRISCSTGPPLVCTNCHEKLFLHPFDHFLWRFMELKSSQCDLPFAQTSRWRDLLVIGSKTSTTRQARNLGLSPIKSQRYPLFCFTNSSPYPETIDFDVHVGHFAYYDEHAKDGKSRASVLFLD